MRSTSNEADGSINFEPIEYTTADIGTHYLHGTGGYSAKQMKMVIHMTAPSIP